MNDFNNVDTVKVSFIDNSGDGTATFVDVEVDTTLGEFLEDQGISLTGNAVRFNRAATTNYDQVLVEGSRISISPKKVAGARQSA